MSDEMPRHRIRCAEIWGGIREADLDVCTNDITASLYCSASEGGKGGDIYYFSVCGGDMITRISMADVTGHGEVVSCLGQWVYDAMAERMDTLDGHLILADLNKQILERGVTAMTTAAVMTYYPGTSHLYFSYAGHPPQFFRRHGDSAWCPATLTPSHHPANLPLGVTAGTIYEQGQIPFASGDRLFLFTDGVLEAPDANGNPFGPKRLLAVLQQSGEASLFALKHAVVNALRQHTGGSLEHDDVTLMAVEIS